MMDLILTILIITIANAYIVQYLLLVKKDSHFGYLSSSTKVVKFPEVRQEIADQVSATTPEHKQPVTPIDWLRRLFNAYDVQGNEWVVTDNADVWTCPFCLSFWIAFGSTATVIYLHDVNPVLLVFIHFAVAFGTQKIIDFDHQEGIVE